MTTSPIHHSRESRVRYPHSPFRAARGGRRRRGSAGRRHRHRVSLRLAVPRAPAQGRRPRPQRPCLRPLDGGRGDPGAVRRRLRHPGVQPVRRRAVRAGLHAGHVQRRHQRRLLHPCAGPRRQPRRRADQRPCHRRRPVVRRQRHAGLLAGRGEHQHRAPRRPGALGRRAGRADAPGARQGRHDPDAQPARQRVVQRRLPGRQRGGRPGELRLAAAVAVAQRHLRQLDRRQLEHGLRRRRGRPRPVLPDAPDDHRRPHPGRPREAVPDGGPARRLPGLRARPAPEQHRHHLGGRAHRGAQHRAVPLLRRQAR
ncbi:hypothetical protein SBRY_40774 [Actinacidiphila bryophytorum]|uniref:Uncharacterized protein n=1 Tax=Actinacidiphila bryophytorum TaxID=1436133 RepID=A0A9W4MHJ1_9ACTN|nr:hypothetical protein SBRY_40774 [Actinacidiphila bryophytorum]